MAEGPARRRLAAILAADVVGYGRLMGQDEAGTLATLKSRRREVLEPLVAKHQGRVFKVAGAGALLEFASAVNAVQCAVDLQQAMAAANVDQPEHKHIVLRIGVGLGDVMVEGSDLYGDGINIAARLQGIAEPGGILVSGTAYDHVRNKVKVGFDDLGSQNLKSDGSRLMSRVSPTSTGHWPFGCSSSTCVGTRQISASVGFIRAWLQSLIRLMAYGGGLEHDPHCSIRPYSIPSTA